LTYDHCVVPYLRTTELFTWISVRHGTVAHEVLLAIEHSLRQHLGSGTVCRLTQDNMTCPIISLCGHLSHFWLGIRATAQCDLC